MDSEYLLGPAQKSLLVQQLGFGTQPLPQLQNTSAREVPNMYGPAPDTLARQAWDAARAVPVGLVNSATGAAGLAATGLGYLGNMGVDALGFNLGENDYTRSNPLTYLGSGILGLGTRLGEWNRGLNSEMTQHYQAMDDANAQAFAEENAAKRDAAIARNEGSFTGTLGAHLSSIGRGMGHGATNFSNHRSFVPALTEAAGSLLGVGAVAKLGQLGNAVVRKGLEKAGMEQAAAGVSRLEALGNTRWGDRLRTSALYGGMEGGGAMAGVLAEAGAMTHEQLLQTSPQYRSLIAQGMAPEDAREAVTNRAIAEAGGMQSVLGAGIGASLGGWARKPLGAPSLRGIAKHVGEETLEEGLQSGTGTLAQNLAVQRHLDENRQWSEGIGEEIGQGALLGGLSAGAVQSPRALALGAKRFANWQAQKPDTATAPAPAPAPAPALAPAQEPTPTPAQQASTPPATAQEAVAQATEEALEDGNAYPAEIAEVLGRHIDKPRLALQEMMDLLQNSQDPVVQAQAMFFVDGVATHYPQLQEDEAIKQLYGRLTHEGGDLNHLMEVMQGLDAGVQERLTPEYLTSDEGRARLAVSVLQAQQDFTQGDKGTIDKVLALHQEGDIGLTDDQVAVLKTQRAVLDAIANTTDSAVTQSLFTTDGEKLHKHWGTYKDKKHVSVQSLAREVALGLRDGDEGRMEAALHRLRNLAAHMQNKMNAMNLQLEGEAERLGFMGLDGKKGKLVPFTRKETQVFVNPHSKPSIVNYQQVAKEQQVLVGIYNALAGVAGSSETLNTIPVHPALEEGSNLPAPVKNNNAVELVRAQTVDVAQVETMGQSAAERLQAALSKKPVRTWHEETLLDALDGKLGNALARTVVEPERDAVDEPAPKDVQTGDLVGDVAETQEKTVAADSGPAETVSALDSLPDKPLGEEQPRLPPRNHHTAKDLKKSDKANKFIGRGSNRSSTKQYEAAWGKRANTGKYESADVVFVSTEGNRSGRTLPPWRELGRAMQAGATLIADNATDRNRAFNIGERELAAYLAKNGYRENQEGGGVWVPAGNGNDDSTRNARNQTKKPEPAKAEESKSADKGSGVVGSSNSVETESPPNKRASGTATQEGNSGPGSNLSGDINTVPQQGKVTVGSSNVAEDTKESPQTTKNTGLTSDEQESSSPDSQKTVAPAATKPQEAEKTVDPGEGSQKPAEAVVASSEASVKKEPETGPAEGIFLPRLGQSINKVARHFRSLSQPRSKLAWGRLASKGELGLREVLTTDAAKRSYKKLVKDLLPEVKQRMNYGLGTWLNTPYLKGDVSQGNRRHWIEAEKLKYENQANTRLLGLTTKDDKGNYRYIPEVVEAASLAVVQELLLREQQGVRLYDDDLASLVGEEHVHKITTEQMEVLQNTHLLANIKQGAARRIAQYMGITYNKDSSTAQNQGLLESLAAEVLQKLGAMNASFVHVELLHLDVTPEGKSKTNKTLSRVRIDFTGEWEGLALVPEALNEAVLGEREGSAVAVGEEWPRNHEMVLHSNVPVTEIGMEALRKRSKQKFTLNKGVYQLFSKLGGEGLGKLFAGVEDYGGMQDLERSAKGKKDSFARPFATLQKLVARTEAINKEARDTVPIRFGRAMSRAWRMQMQGTHNPQSSKLMRVALKTHTTDVPIQDGHATHQTFIRAVGQALGVKVDKLPVDEGIAKTHELLQSLDGAVILLDELNRQTKPVTDTQIARLRQLLQDAGANVTPVAIQALLEYRHYQYAQAEGESTFASALSYEADGITNGVINSLMGFYVPVTKYELVQWVKNLRRGGVVIGPKRNWAEILKTGTKDVYESTAAVFQEALRTVLDPTPQEIGTGKTETEGQARFRASSTRDIIQLLAAFNPDVQVDEAGVTFKRSFMKSPVMVINYASGVMGVSKGMVDDLVEQINLRLHEGYQQGKSLKDIIAPAQQSTLRLMGFHLSEGREAKPVYLEPQKRVFNKYHNKWRSARDEAADLLARHFTSTLVESVKRSLGQTAFETMHRVGSLLQAQSIYMAQRFQEEVTKAVEANGNQHLSQKQQETVFQKLLDSMPQALSQYQRVVFERTQEIDHAIAKKPFSATLDDRLTSNTELTVPGDIGISAVPLTNIAFGDALMMMQLAADGVIDGEMLDTFDGISLPLDRAARVEQDINRVIWQQWMDRDNHPLAAVVKQFNSFLESEEGKNFLAKAGDIVVHKPKRREPVTAQDVLDEHWGRLQKANELHTALRRVMHALPMSVNQMAGMHSPYHGNGGDFEGLAPATPNQIADFIEKSVATLLEQGDAAFAAIVREADALFDKFSPEEIPVELPNVISKQPTHTNPPFLGDKVGAGKNNEKGVEGSKTTGTATADQGTVRGNPPRSNPQKHATTTPQKTKVANPYITSIAKKTGGHAVPAAQVVSWLKNSHYSRLSAANQWLVDHVLPLLTGSGVAVRFSEQRRPGVNAITRGSYFQQEGVVDIYTDRADLVTVVHELTHAVTVKGLAQYVKDKSRLSEAARSAAENIETLMEQYKEQLQELDGSNVLRRNALARLLQPDSMNEAQRFTALSEFVAYGLTERPVSNFLRKLKNLILQLIYAFTGKQAGVAVHDALQALQLNVQVLAAETMPGPEAIVDEAEVLHQLDSTVDSDSVGLGDIRRNISRYVRSVLDKRDNLPEDRVRAHEQVIYTGIRAQEQLHWIAKQGIVLDEEQAKTYGALLTLFATVPHIPQPVLKGIAALYNKALHHLEPAHFTGMDAPLAQSWHKVLLNTSDGSKAARGVFSNFAALALVAPQVKTALRKLDGIPDAKAGKVEWGAIERMWQAAGHWLQGKTPQGADSLQQEVAKMLQAINHANTHPVAKANTAMTNFMEHAEAKASGLVRDVLVKGTAAAGLKKISAVANGAWNGYLGELTNTGLSKAEKYPLSKIEIHQTVRELVSDFIGRTPGKAALFDMVKRTRTTTQQYRQVMREHIPATFYAMFGPQTGNEDYNAMTDVLARTDMASLVRDKTLGAGKALSLVGDSKALAQEIAAIERDIQGKAGKVEKGLGDYYLARTKALGLFMAQRTVHANQPRNAQNIVQFHGEVLAAKPKYVPHIDQIDTLASLYALQASNTAAVQRVVALIKRKPDAVRAVLEYLEYLNGEEPNTSSNRFKGYVPITPPDGAALITAPMAEQARLEQRGYEMVQAIPHTTQALFYSPTSTQAPFTQGLIQTVHSSDGGADMASGNRIGMASGRVMTFEQAKERSLKYGNALLDAHAALRQDSLLPIYSKHGQVVGYEVALSNDLINKAGADRNLAKAMGVWRGRQVEVAFAQEVNRQVFQELDAMYEKASVSDRKAFININDTQVLASNFGQREAQRLLPPEFKAMAGKDPVWVRRDMVKEVLGYRNLSAVMIWDNQDPLSRTAAKVLDALFGAAGRNAYADVLKFERMWQEGVYFIKDAIVVKSMFVPAINMASNMMQLGLHGINPLNVLKAIPQKVREAEYYLKLRGHKATLEVEREAAIGEEAKAKKQRQLDVVDTQMRKLSIWPLIEAGELTSLLDGMYKPEHIQEVGTGLGDAIKARIDKLPKHARAAVKYAYLSQDTKLYQLLQKSTQYGDFVAKAVLYDHLTRQGKSREEALGRVSEEFVNYEITPGAVRGYLESIGAMWFGNYFMRSVKIALRLAKEKPLAALMLGSGIHFPFLGHVGTPLTDNLFGKASRGVLPFSIGFSDMASSSQGIPALPAGRVLSLLMG